MSDRILVLGATSGIARALCGQLARQGHQLILAGRNSDELERMATDLRLRCEVTVLVELFEALEFDSHEPLIRRCAERLDGPLNGVIFCCGYMPEQVKTETDFLEVKRTIDTNLTAAISILNAAANYLSQGRSGFIAAISSVAGDRGRQSNYIYGCSKAGLNVYLAGLRNRLHRSGVHVLTIKPGFVDTPMTEGLIDPRSLLLASPERVARDIVRAIQRRRNQLYVPWFWRCIMTVICALPETIFKRMKL